MEKKLLNAKPWRSVICNVSVLSSGVVQSCSLMCHEKMFDLEPPIVVGETGEDTKLPCTKMNIVMSQCKL